MITTVSKVQTTKKFLMRNMFYICLFLVMFTVLFSALSIYKQINNANLLYFEKITQVLQFNKNEILNEIALNDVAALKEHLNILLIELNADKIVLEQDKFSLEFNNRKIDTLSFPMKKFIRMFIPIAPIEVPISNDFDNFRANIKLDYVSSFTNRFIIPTLMSAIYSLLFVLGLISVFFVLLYHKFKNCLITPLRNISEALSNSEFISKPIKLDPVPLYLKDISDVYNALMEYERLRQLANSEINRTSHLAAIGQTSQMLAHDVRKPFSQIKILLSLLNQIKDDPSSINKAVKDIDASIKHVESMLSDIMNFSREVNLGIESSSVVEIVASSLHQLSQISGKKDIKFKYSFSNTRKIMADHVRLSRALINIIENAIDAIDEKGIIRITCSDIVINNKRSIQLVAANDGPFIQEEDLQKIFTPFFTKNKNRGTGLGLASAKKIVSLHDGTILAKNNRENNTVEFIITIPASEEMDDYSLERLPENLNDIVFPKYKNNREQIESTVQHLKNSGYSFKILLLEDEPLYRASVKNTIKQIPALSAMITLYDAKSYDEAFALVKYENITHAIIDIDLGEEKDGFNFLKEIGTSGRKIESMIHSNRHLDTFRQKAFELGAKSFVPKPLTLEHLLEFLVADENVPMVPMSL